MRNRALSIVLSAVAVSSATHVTAALAATQAASARQSLTEQVRDSERAFARSMADRDLKAFASHVAQDAVFVSGDEVLRGREAVVAGWQRYFTAASAPFSWSPEQVEVLADGRLAFSSGPVLNSKGERIATFKSTWRRERDGHWRVAIDSGCSVCNCAAPPAPAAAPASAAAPSPGGATP